MKITHVGTVTIESNGLCYCMVQIGGNACTLPLADTFDPESKEPTDITELFQSFWRRDLKRGDYVVHLDHGIGVYQGEKTRVREKDCIILHYRGGDRLYVPLERIDLIQKHFSPKGRPPQLDKLVTGRGPSGKFHELKWTSSMWVFRRKVFFVEGAEVVPQDEIMVRVKHASFRQDKELNRIQKEVAALENFQRLPSARREQLPESVRLFVWQRDSALCEVRF